jgi:photosystem II stability/assembly factor-like uncharacterized protein
LNRTAVPSPRRLLISLSLCVAALGGCEDELASVGPSSASKSFPGWVAQDSGSSLDLRAVAAIDSDLAWTSAGPTLLRTEDGETWSDAGGVPEQQSSIVPGLSSPVLDVRFFDARNGFALTQYSLLFTADGGQTWEPRPTSINARKRAMSFIDPSTGWLVYEGGWGISRTSDGGATWDYIPRGEVHALKFVDAQTGWMAARTGWDPGHDLFRSTDGGETWVKAWASPAGSDARIAGIAAADENHAWFIERDRVYATADGGATWSSRQIEGSGDLTSLCFVDSRVGWCVGRTIHKTSDGGSTWTVQPTEREGFTDIDFADATTGWAVGENGIIFKTTTAGDR